jgi:hypothetical protein
LPKLDQPVPSQTRSAKQSNNALEQFLSEFSSPRSARAVEVAVCATAEWTVHQVEIEVVRQSKAKVVNGTLREPAT